MHKASAVKSNNMTMFGSGGIACRQGSVSPGFDVGFDVDFFAQTERTIHGKQNKRNEFTYQYMQ